MAEKTPSFTVSDRRKFTLEGDLRDQTAAAPEEAAPAHPAGPAAPAPPPAADAKPGPRLVTTPPAPGEEPELQEDEELLVEPTAEESAEQHAAYKQSSEELESMLRQANPGLCPSAPAPIAQ